jgi:hypothetical protein
MAALLLVARFAGHKRFMWCMNLSERRRRELADNSQILASGICAIVKI